MQYSKNSKIDCQGKRNYKYAIVMTLDCQLSIAETNFRHPSTESFMMHFSQIPSPIQLLATGILCSCRSSKIVFFRSACVTIIVLMVEFEA